MGVTAEGYWLNVAKTPLVKGDVKVGQAGAGEAVVEVIACGLCHTDLGFARGSVPTRKEPPIVLGHEAVGKVVEAGAGAQGLVGRTVIVPAVLPCGECAFCKAGRGNACPNQKMPGNDIDGGFATHMLVPAAPLVRVDDLGGDVDLRQLSVVADAVSTAYQAVLRADLQAGDLAVVVGSGGVGGFTVQIAAALGATVVACDVRAAQLERIGPFGATHLIDVSSAEPRAVRKQVRGIARELGVTGLRLKIFECSGHPAGQELAYTLLDRGATMIQAGYTPAKLNLRLSNLMAFDATVHGTWGCPPEAYRPVLQLIADGKVQLGPFVDYAPMSTVNDQLRTMAEGHLEHRMILDPRA